MSNENYKKCKTCRFCIHSDENWVCSVEGIPTKKEDTCARYRPGSCENCNNLQIDKNGTVCSLTGEETYVLSVCSEYDPSGRRSI